MANLRRNQRKISTLGRNKEKFNAKSVKVKWTNIEKKITKVSARYHYVCSFLPTLIKYPFGCVAKRPAFGSSGW